MTEEGRKEIRQGYITEYKELTGKDLVCIENKNSLGHYKGVARVNLLKVVSDYSGITTEILLSETRKREVVKVRQMMCYLLIQMKITFSEVGKIFNQHHTNVISTSNTVKGMISVDKEYKLEYNQFKKHCVTELKKLVAPKYKLDEHQRKAIKDSLKNGGITRQELAEIYDVHVTTINRIKNNKNKRK